MIVNRPCTRHAGRHTHVGGHDGRLSASPSCSRRARADLNNLMRSRDSPMRSRADAQISHAAVGACHDTHIIQSGPRNALSNCQGHVCAPPTRPSCACGRAVSRARVGPSVGTRPTDRACASHDWSVESVHVALGPSGRLSRPLGLALAAIALDCACCASVEVSMPP